MGCIFTVAELLRRPTPLSLSLPLSRVQLRPGICLKSENESKKVNNVNPAEYEGKAGVLEFPELCV